MYLWPPLCLRDVEGHDVTDTFSGAFLKLRKVAVSFVISIRPPARMEKPGSQWTGFHEISYFEYFFFRKSLETVQVSLKYDKNKEEYFNL